MELDEKDLARVDLEHMEHAYRNHKLLQYLLVYSLSALPAPNFILNAIKALQRKILWQGLKAGKKFSLISWENISRTKIQGGIGIKYPSIVNKVLNTKIWWHRWLKRPQDLWANL
jgi:hypothetical protein